MFGLTFSVEVIDRLKKNRNLFWEMATMNSRMPAALQIEEVRFYNFTETCTGQG